MSKRVLLGFTAITMGLSLAAQDESRGGNGLDRAMPRVRPAPGMAYSAPTGGRAFRGHDSWFEAPRRRVLLAPPAMERCTVVPTELWWKRRDVITEIQRMSRRGMIPVTPVSGLVDTWQDEAIFPAGWKAYGFVVPARGELEVRLTHPNLGWFRLMMVNKWGSLQEGMLQNLIPKGYPVATFKNPKNSAQEVFVIVDDPGWMSTKQYPYTMVVKRSWDSRQEKPDAMPQTVGIWARHHEVIPRIDPEHAAPDPAVGPATKSR